MVPPQDQKTSRASHQREANANRVDSVTRRCSPSSRDISSTFKRTSSGGYLSDQGAIGKCSRAAARLQPAVRETLVNPIKSSGPCRYRHSHQRFNSSFPQASSTSEESISACSPDSPKRVLNPHTHPVRGGLAQQGNYHQPKHPHSGVLEQDIPRSQERWQTKTSPGPFIPESFLEDSKLKNGASRKNPVTSMAVNVGFKPRHYRCFPSSLNKQSFPEVFLLSLQRNYLHVPSNAVWLDNGTLGFFKTYETHQNLSKAMGSHSQFIYRRLSESSYYQRPSHTAQFMDQVSLDLAWFHNQRREISTNPLSGYRIPRRHTKLQGVNYVPPVRQSGKDSLYDSPVNRLSYSYQKTTRVSGRSSDVRTQNDAPRQNAYKQGHCLAEPVHKGLFKGHPSDSRPKLASSARTFHAKVPTRIPSVLSSSHSIPDYHDGRLKLWMVGGTDTLQGQRCLEYSGSFILHKCSRITSSLQNPRILQGFPSEHYGQNPYRQYGHFVLFKENGFFSFTANEQRVQGFSLIVSRVQNPVCGSPYRGSSECLSRQGFTHGPYKHRDHARPGLITIYMEPVELIPMARRFCFTGNFEMSLLRFALPGSESLRHRCLSPRLERLDHSGSEHAFFPSSCLDADASGKICGFQRPWGPDSSLQWSFLAFSSNVACSRSSFAPKGLFSFPMGKGQFSHSKKESGKTSCVSPVAQRLAPHFNEHSSINLPSSSNRVAHQSVPIQANGIDTNTGDPDEIRLEVCFNNLLKKGYSLDAANLFANSHKDSTINQYQSGWKLWLSYLKSHNIPNHKVTSITLCNFLAFQGVQIDRSLTTVKNYFYALRKPFKLFYNADLPSKDDIDALFNGLYHRKPPSTKEDLAPKWSLSALLEYLRGPAFEPLQAVPFKMVELKAFILILLATGRRVGEINSASFFEVKFVGDDKVELGWFPTFRAKAERSNSSWVPANPSFYALAGASDDLLCPYRAFLAFYELRCSLPHEAHDGYLWTRRLKHFTNLVRDTILDALKQFQPNLTGVPDLLVRVHQLRKFAISLAKKYLVVSDDDLCKVVGSRRITVPYKRYISDVPMVQFSCQIPCGTLHPSLASH